MMEMHSPKISVILTSFNHGKFIGEAIDSVLMQTFTDFELIIWDDASSDDSWEVIQRYSDPRIRKFRNEKSGRAIVGINRAIHEIAQGKFIAIHHSDDSWHPEKLAKQVFYLEENPEVGAVFTNANIILEDGSPLQDETHFYFKVFSQPNRTRHEWLRQFFMEGNVLCHPSILIRKECYQVSGPYRYGFAQLGDFDMWVRLCLHYPIHVLPQKLTNFRILNAERNTSGNRYDSRIRSYVELVHVLHNYLEISDFKELLQILPDAKKFNIGERSNIHFALAMVALDLGNNPVYKLFSLNILFNLILDPSKSHLLKQDYNFDYLTLISLTGKYDIFRDETVRQLQQAFEGSRHELELQIAETTRLNHILADLQNSTSWRLTAPLRALTASIRRILRALRRAPSLIKDGGELSQLAFKAIRILRNEGLIGVKLRLRRIKTNMQQQREGKALQVAQQKVLEIAPLYLDPNETIDFELPINSKLGIHLTISQLKDLTSFIDRAKHWEIPFALYVSTTTPEVKEAAEQQLRQALPKLENLQLLAVSERSFPLTVGDFATELSQHELIGLFDLSKECTQSGLDLMFGSAFASTRHFYKLLAALSQDSCIIYPEFSSPEPQEPSGWGTPAERRHLETLLEESGAFKLKELSTIDFPRQGMLWAQSRVLKSFLSQLQLQHPVIAPAQLEAYKRLPLLLASRQSGLIRRIHQGDSIADYRHYEEAHDFSASIVHDDIKVLAYYLPQFHPIPENDQWHGKGFTEWTKVRAANPLFQGHFQQHIPHEDTGYYLLDSADTLRKQAKQMRHAGVYGQVFYHYWFTGKLILEEPARMLLATPDVEMPFCFCWANENWTRRWDGNESEILLGQDYSADDARAFIQYLIPFFKDPRYIRVDGRPMLSIYRPSSIPNAREYLNIWAEECAAHGVERPYVVAVLTRGAVDPRDFGMDAGIERVLHDWTGGGVVERKHELKQFTNMAGSVLLYDEVADFYAKQTAPKDFPYFRSLVPTWDNTARYDERALLLHDSTPQKFQEWLESCIQFSKEHLAKNQRFILVNAWNEWAEGAHLEPDTRFGYSYLNSVGRALSAITYGQRLTSEQSQGTPTQVHIQLSLKACTLLKQDKDLQQRFWNCMHAALATLEHCLISADVEASSFLSIQSNAQNEADFTLHIDRPALFDETLIAKLLETAKAAPGSVVVPTDYTSDPALIKSTENCSVSEAVAYRSSMRLVPTQLPEGRLKNIRLRTDAYAFECQPWSKESFTAPKVTTIIRFHRTGNLEQLKNALYSLAAMRNCEVTPLVTAQDLSDAQKVDLEKLLQRIPLPNRATPRIEYYETPDGKGDLRSRMLNHAMSLVNTRYAAFLDYDDLLMPHAYEWMHSRLEKTGKAATFGRIYATFYNGHTGEFLERRPNFEYGFSYEDFITNNHTPLHGFLLDMSQIDLSTLIYHDDHRFMEDYFLTLQLFTKSNTDWDSLRENTYIGDYIHSIERNHTLAFTDETEKQTILKNPQYQLCEKRIHDLRKLIINRKAHHQTTKTK
ncbi:glycoside hydrolase family 99-like domain-containing protein [Aquipseudomonas alcaligenes]|uniref:Glycosyl transferase family 2 n=1 Tax=Aquipseudomonas alcaligenes TaxID=43263 RepID=A0A1N6RTE0_AQUAC|nr:glycoside hydrolase family 99-like domain-containing protein [Pseudomonas alcaligenes]SIQ32051.1 Glycosyl transferase family 2 [Pseudomonas alcaligenes]